MSTVTALADHMPAGRTHMIQYSDKVKWIEEVSVDPDLTASDVRVGVVLSRFINSRSGRAILSYDSISDKAPISTRTAMRAINALVAAGYLVVQRERGRGRANVYALALDGAPIGSTDAGSQPEKCAKTDTLTDEKGDTPDTFSGIKGDKIDRKRCQNRHEKGDTGGTPTKSLNQEKNTKRARSRTREALADRMARTDRVFITTDDVRWPWLAERFRKRVGRNLTPYPVDGVAGWFFEPGEVDACPNPSTPGLDFDSAGPSW